MGEFFTWSSTILWYAFFDHFLQALVKGNKTTFLLECHINFKQWKSLQHGHKRLFCSLQWNGKESNKEKDKDGTKPLVVPLYDSLERGKTNQYLLFVYQPIIFLANKPIFVVHPSLIFFTNSCSVIPFHIQGGQYFSKYILFFNSPQSTLRRNKYLITTHLPTKVP